MLISFVFGLVRLFEDDGKPVPALANVLKVAQQIRKSDKPLNNKATIKDYLLTKWCHTKNGSFYPPSKERDEQDMCEHVSSKQVDVLFENFRKLGMVDSYEPEVDNDLRYIVFWSGHYPHTVTHFEAAKKFYMKKKGRFKNLKIIILTDDREMERSRGPKKPLDYGVPDHLKTSKEVGYYLAKDTSLPIFVVHCTKQRAHTPHWAMTLKNWLLLEKNPRGGTIVVVIRQPLSQNVLTVFDRCFKNTPFNIKMLATPSLFRGANQDPMAEAINRMLPNRPAKLSNKDIAKCMDVIARTVSLMDQDF